MIDPDQICSPALIDQENPAVEHPALSLIHSRYMIHIDQDTTVDLQETRILQLSGKIPERDPQVIGGRCLDIAIIRCRSNIPDLLQKQPETIGPVMQFDLRMKEQDMGLYVCHKPDDAFIAHRLSEAVKRVNGEDFRIKRISGRQKYYNGLRMCHADCTGSLQASLIGKIQVDKDQLVRMLYMGCGELITG